MKKSQKKLAVRKNCHDIWNAFMVKNAIFCKYDIPFCPNTTDEIPKRMITYSNAKAIYKSELQKKHKDFQYDAYVCFFEDDQNFDSRNGIWFYWKIALRILCHFTGVITPDFSTYKDFPLPIRTWNTYRMRAFGYWWGNLGFKVINNVRWNNKESYKWSFLGIPVNSILCIGTVASGLRSSENRQIFEDGLRKMIKVLNPKVILVYGSANYPFFNEICKHNIKILSYPSETSFFYKKMKLNKSEAKIEQA